MGSVWVFFSTFKVRFHKVWVFHFAIEKSAISIVPLKIICLFSLLPLRSFSLTLLFGRFTIMSRYRFFKNIFCLEFSRPFISVHRWFFKSVLEISYPFFLHALPLHFGLSLLYLWTQAWPSQCIFPYLLPSLMYYSFFFSMMHPT